MAFTQRRRSKKQSNTSSAFSKKVWAPHEYQQDSVKRFVSRSSAGVFAKPGLGKTSITYFAFKILKEKKIVNSMCVVASRRIIYNSWPKENEKWDGLGFKVRTLHGPRKEKELLEGIAERADVYLINYEGLEWLRATLKKHRIKTDKFAQMLVLDESSKIKNSNSKRFRLLRGWIKEWQRRYILTGSPAPNSLIDIWAQIFFLDGGKSLGTKTAFRNRFFYPSGYMGYVWLPYDNCEEQIFDLIDDLVFRPSGYQVDEPEVVPVVREVKLPKEAMQLYRDMESEFVSELSSGAVLAKNAAVASGKCRQIASGGLYYEVRDERTGKMVRKWQLVHDEKTEELKELVEELQGTPCFVAYEFEHDLERLKAAFPDAPHLGKGVSDVQASKIIDDWNAGRLQVLFGQPQSVAHGLNLQEVEAVVVWYTPTWNLENYEQFIQRIARQGYKGSHVYVYHLIAEDTVDEVVMAAIEHKDFKQSSLLKALEKRYSGNKNNVIEDTEVSKANQVQEILSWLAANRLKVPPFIRGIEAEEQEFISILDDYIRTSPTTQLGDLVYKLASKKVNAAQPCSIFVDEARSAVFSALGIVVSDDTGVNRVQDYEFCDHWPKVITKPKKGDTLMAFKKGNTKSAFAKPTSAEEKKEVEKAQPARKNKAAADKPSVSKSSVAAPVDKAEPKKKSAIRKAAEPEQKPAKKAAVKKAAPAEAKPAKQPRSAKAPVEKAAPAKKSAPAAKNSGGEKSKQDAELLKLLGRKTGCSVDEAAEKLGTTGTKVRGMIGRLRKAGEKIESAGKGVFKL